MATQVQWRGGSTAEHSTFTGAAREVTVDTQKKTLVVHDGSTAGGEPLLREDQANLPTSVTNGISVPSANNVAISTNGTGRLFVDASGNVGVGTNTPQSIGSNIATVHARGSNGGGIAFGSTSHAQSLALFTSGDGSVGTLGTYVNMPLTFVTNSTERMRLDSSGRLGLGTSSPGANLQVTRTSGDSSDIVRIGQDQGFYLGIARSNATGAFSFQGSQVGNNDILLAPTSGRVGIGTTSPSFAFHCNANFASTNTVERVGAFYRVSSGTASAGIGSEISLGAEMANSSLNTSCTIRGILPAAGNEGEMALTTGDSSGTQQERLRIDSSGRLLVGTSTQQGTHYLQIQGSATASSYPGSIFLRRGLANASISSDNQLGVIDFGNQDGGVGATISAEGDAQWGSNDYPGRLVFSTTADGASSPTERMRITSGGSVCINTTDAQISRLSIEGSSDALYNAVFHDTRSAAAGSTPSILFKRATASVGSISTTSASTAYNTSSDYRLKENIVPLTGAAARVQQLKPSQFNFITEPGKTVDGFIAHEAQAVVPECVTGTKDEVDDEGNPVYQGIDQSKLVPLLTAALQEALAEIESLKARVTALEP